MTDHPPWISTVNQMAPVPRRIRAVVAGRTILDTTGARYVWEHPRYPQYYIPVADIDPAVLVDEDHQRNLSRGTARRFGVQVGDVSRSHALHVYGDDAIMGVAGMARFQWGSIDAWYEEDERVFVHPRDPYTRSMPSGPRAPWRSASGASSSPGQRRRSWSSRPGCPRATTSTRWTSTKPT